MLLCVLGCLTATSGATGAPCNGTNKQKALYIHYNLDPPLSDTGLAATDISVEHLWNNTADMRKYGSNGVYAAQPIYTVGGPGGYFGSQSDADPSAGGLLFSIWDKKRGHPFNASASCPPSAVGPGKRYPNETWCETMHAFPLVPSCHRNCNDCGLHPGWHNTTGTQCGVAMELSGGDGVRFRLWQSAPNATLADPLGMGLDYHGAEWTLTATLLDSRRGHGPDGRTLAALSRAAGTAAAVEAAPIVVGKMFLQDTYSGIGRFSAFHEHIGCTPCDAFYESEVRRGPWVDAPLPKRVVSNITFGPRPPCACQLFDVDIPDPTTLPGGVPQAQFRTGPGTGPRQHGGRVP